MADQLNPELLLTLFKSLNSQDMIKSKRVCRAWSDIINGNKILYRHVILPERKGGWDVRILKLFDEKSHGGLVEISIKLDASIRQRADLGQVLIRSQDSLRKISIIWDHVHSPDATKALFWEIFFAMPRLLEFKAQTILPREPSSVLKQVNNSSPSSSSRLRILWLPMIYFSYPSPSLRLDLLDNLVSLRLSQPLKSHEWRDSLESSSKTLKDLHVSFRRAVVSDSLPEPRELEFPRLEFLFVAGGWDIPEWVKVPFSCTIKLLTTNSSLIPSVSRLFVGYIAKSEHLSNLCPLLKELRIEVTNLPKWASTIDTDPKSWNYQKEAEMRSNEEFLEMLRKRRWNVENGVEIDGVKMIHLKTLVISFKYFSKMDPEFIGKARDLVEEVVDLETVQRFVEIEF